MNMTFKGVVQCEGIIRKSWMTKCVALQNDAGVIVGKGICHNVDFALIIDSDNQPFGDDRVVVQIANSLSERDVPSDWVFQLRAWHISRIFLNGASLYDHEQMHLFCVSSGPSCHGQVLVGFVGKFSKFSTKKQGDNFARCGDCDDLKRMRSACTRVVGLMLCARKDWICTLWVKECIKSSTMQIGFSRRRNQRSV